MSFAFCSMLEEARMSSDPSIPPTIPDDGLSCFHPVTQAWFRAVFDAPTAPQRLGWPVIARGESTLILAPTGTGKTLTAFLWCLDRLMLVNRDQGSEIRDQENPNNKRSGAPGLDFETGEITESASLKGHGFSRADRKQKNSEGASAPVRKGTGFSPYISAQKGKGASAPAANSSRKPAGKGCRIVYVSPLKALAVDVERNLRSPLTGIANMARRMGVPFHEPEIAVRTGDTPHRERARFQRQPSEILITTPESLYLILTSQAADALRTVDTVIIDEIHALVPTKRGAHLSLSLERLEALVKKPLQRIGLSATQRPLEEVARFLGGVEVQGSGNRDQGTESRARGQGSRVEDAGYTAAHSQMDSLQDENSASAALAATAESLDPWSSTLDPAPPAGSLVPGPSVPASAPAEPLTPDPCSLIPGEAPLCHRPVTIVNASAPK